MVNTVQYSTGYCDGTLHHRTLPPFTVDIVFNSPAREEVKGLGQEAQDGVEEMRRRAHARQLGTCGGVR